MNMRETVLYWDSEADSLTKARVEALNGEERVYWEEALSVLLPADTPLRILEAGSGSGFLAVILTGLGHNVIGIDISPAMVQCAYETASASGLRIEYRIMDCNKMEFKNESFDAVVCCELMTHLSDVKSALIEFRRILRKDGRLIIFDTGDMILGQVQARGFSHCRVREFEGLRAVQHGESLHCLSARKPVWSEQDNIAQITLFNRHIQTAKKQIQLYQNWCQSIGMPYPEYTVLNMISRHSKGVRPSDISSALVIPPQTLTRILASLNRDGYINRQTSSRDQRSVNITITETGMEKMRPLQNALRDIEEKALLSFDTDELVKLIELSDKLLNALDSSFRG